MRPEDIKIVFMGTSSYAEPSLKALHNAGYSIPLVITQPDRRKGRNRKSAAPPVKTLAESLGLTVYQPEKVLKAECCEKLQFLSPDLLITASYGQILRKKHLNIPRYGVLNVHASLLPLLRGAAPIQYSIIRGHKETGVTIMQTERGLDTGPIISARKIPLSDSETAGSLMVKLADLGADLLVETIPKYLSGDLLPTPQDHSMATHAPQLFSEHGWIEWNHSATEISQQIRGMNPCPGAYTSCKGQRLKIHMAFPYQNDSSAPVDTLEQLIPGTITGVVKGKGITVRTGDGDLLITELQPACKKRMQAEALILGRYANPREILGEPLTGKPLPCQQ